MKSVSKNKKLKNAIIVVSVVLGAVVIGLGITLAVFITKSNTYKLQLENTYKRNYYEFVDNINTLEVDLSKLIATNSLSSQKELLTNIYDNTRTSAVNLSSLPIASDKISNLSNYLNTLGGYTYSLLEKNLTNDEKMTESDVKTIEGLYNYVVDIKWDLNCYVTDIENFSITKMVNYANGDSSAFDAGLREVNNNNDKLPSLIYDGPFSDSVINKEIKALSDEVLSEAEVRNKLKNDLKFFENYTVDYVGDTLGRFATYNYNVSDGNSSLYVQLTKRDGFLLSINSLNEGQGDKNLSVSECELFAHNFASLMGFDNMYSVWSQAVGDTVYINLAPIIDHVIYYPDLIKVKVNKNAGVVVGWEATNYAYNHVERDAFSPSISFDQAESLLSSALTVKERNLCIIPNKYVGESYAYEFICTWKDYRYYIYIDINTGEELNIVRVVDTSSGDLLM